MQQPSSLEINPNNPKAVVHERLELIPVGVVVRLNSNPIARYNHAIKCYNDSCVIDGIELT